MSTLNTISKLTSTSVALGICFTTGVAQAATIERGNATFDIYDTSGKSYLTTLTPTALKTASGTQYGNQYTFSTNFTDSNGILTGVSVSGTISIANVTYTKTSTAEVGNKYNNAKIFKLSQFEIRNNSLDKTSLNYGGSTVFNFENKFPTLFDMSQFNTVLRGSIVSTNGSTCNNPFNVNLSGYATTSDSYPLAYIPTYVDNTVLNSCKFDAIIDNRPDAEAFEQFYPGLSSSFGARMYGLILPYGYSFKLTNSLDFLATDDGTQTPINDDGENINDAVENFVNVSLGIAIDNPDEFNQKFKIKIFNPETNTSEEIKAKAVPESSFLLGLLVLGGLLISAQFKKVR